MEKCKYCGMNFINKACVTKHLCTGKCSQYVPPKKYDELEAELHVKDEAHKNEIFKLNDMCVAKCRNLKAEIKRRTEIMNNRTEAWQRVAKRNNYLKAENEMLRKLLRDALPHIECKNASQSGLRDALPYITTIGEALKGE